MNEPPAPAGMLVSFVVPARDDVRTLDGCLASLRQQAYARVELIVVDHDSRDGTRAIARRWADVLELAGPGRGTQCNRGAMLAAGDALVFVDPDMLAEPGLAGDVAAAFGGDAGPDALRVPEWLFGRGFLAGCMGLERRLRLGDERAQPVRAVRRGVLGRAGGFDTHLDEDAGLELTARLLAAGVRPGWTGSGLWRDGGRIRLRDTFTRARDASAAAIGPDRHPDGDGAGAPAPRPARSVRRAPLAALPRRQLWLLAAHPVRATGLLALGVAAAAGHAAGLVEARRANSRAPSVPGGVGS